MRIVSWNLAHQTREAPIPVGLQVALASLRPDVLALNEFVDGPSRSTLRSMLSDLGLLHVAVSDRVGQNNQVFIASREPMAQGDIRPPITAGGAGESNFLHVTLTTLRLELVGLRAPAYAAPPLHAYWQRLEAIVRANEHRRLVVIGDLNADPDEPRSPGGKYLAALRRDGWKLPRPSGNWSYLSGTCIDHVLVSPCMPEPAAAYVTEIDGWSVASSARATRISDHAALVVDFA